MSKFIVLEGTDGSGTTTQASHLLEHLRGSGHSAVITSEPSDGPVGSLIRLAFKHRIQFAMSPEEFDTQMAYLFAADRHDHLYNQSDGVLSLLSRGITVISTRYYFSSLAYHVSTDEQEKIVLALNARFPPPDLTVYLDTPVEVSMQRIALRKHTDSYENETKLRLVQSRYRKIWQEFSGDLLIADGSQAPDITSHEIWNFVRERGFSAISNNH